jgi:hypothetical protein
VTRAPAISFIVRVWNDGENTPAVRGEIEHLRTGEKRLFLDFGAMLSMIDAWRQEVEVGA